MIYEVTTQFTKIDNNGNDKAVREKYIIADAELHGEAEEKTYEECDGLTNLDIVAVKRSKVRELVNKRESNEDRIFFAEIADTRINDDGEEVQLVYKVSLFALNFDSAKTVLVNYLKQGFDMEIVGLKCTKFVDVIY